MKKIVYFSIIILTIIACKKEGKVFLTGRLIDTCNGQPVADETINFYQNFEEGVNWLDPDTDAEILETTITNKDGYFFFYGEDYTNKNTVYYANSSVRSSDGRQLVTGNLGEGKGDANGNVAHRDVGDIILNGMTANINFKIATHNNGTYYDSVKLFSSYYDINLTLTDSNSGYFTGEIVDQKLWIKNLWSPDTEGYNQYNLYIRLEFYRNSGNTVKEVWKDFFYNPCITSGQAIFDFE